MNILQVSAEAAPFAKVGGLADMTGALPGAWEELGHKVIPVLPLYGTIDAEKFGITKDGYRVVGTFLWVDRIRNRVYRR